MKIPSLMLTTAINIYEKLDWFAADTSIFPFHCKVLEVCWSLSRKTLFTVHINYKAVPGQETGP